MSDQPAVLEKSRGLIEVRWRETTVPGLWVAEASHLHIHSVLGTVYYRVNDPNETIEIQSTYVVGWARRNGIRTRINDALFEWYPDVKSITSPRGTKDGLKFMKAYGYRKMQKGGWKVYRAWRKKKP